MPASPTEIEDPTAPRDDSVPTSRPSGARILGLSIADRRVAWLATGVVTLAYATSAARHVGLYDSSELALAATRIGLGHPPGQPLHTLLGAFLAHLPGLDPLVGVGLLSALCAGLATIPTLALAERALSPGAPRFLAPAVVVAAALHAVSWEPATRVEVYPLAVFLGLYAIAWVDALDEGRSLPRTLAFAGLLVGLSASANPILAAVAGLCALPRALSAIRRTGPVGSSIVAGLAGVVLGLTPYLYLAFVRTRHDAFVWGGLTTPEEVRHYLTGRDYAGNLGVSAATWLSQAKDFLSYLATERIYGAELLLGAFGWPFLRRTGSIAFVALPVGFSLVLGLVASNLIFRVDVPDYLGYFALVSPLLAVGTCAAVAEAYRRSALGALFVLGLALATALAPPPPFVRGRADDDVAERLSRALLDEMPRDAILVVESDHIAGPLLYLQEQLEYRTDVVVVVRGLMSSHWFVRRLGLRHPSLVSYSIAGPGGRDGRIGRLVRANPDRALRLEHLGLARSLGLVACPGGIALRTGADCRARREPDLRALLEVAGRARRLGSGAVEGRELAAAVTLRIGLDLLRLGSGRSAYVVLVSGLPEDLRPSVLPAPSVVPEALRIDGPEPRWRRVRALADPARNAFAAGLVLSQARAIDGAVAFTMIAAREGLPEAEDLLRRVSR